MKKYKEIDRLLDEQRDLVRALVAQSRRLHAFVCGGRVNGREFMVVEESRCR